jgi:hypothetical protein
MEHPRVPFRVVDSPSADASQSQVIQLEGQRIDAQGRPVTGFRQHHPQMRRLEPMGRPLQPHELPQAPAHMGYGYAPAHGDFYGQQPVGTHVNVNNNQQMYRPWKEELGLSFVKTIGNFFAWPFRLIGNLIENLVLMGAGVLRTMLLLIVGPMLLMGGYSFYQANQDKPATEIAAELGKEGVGLVGAMLGGIWDGVFGDDEPTPAEKAKEAPAK